MIGFFQRLKKKRGFTLIELIVVIAILAILAAILVPTMMNIVGTARDQVKKSNAAAVFSAAQAAYVTLAVVQGKEIEVKTEGYKSSDSDEFINEIKKNLGSGSTATEAFTVYVGDNGVEYVQYGDSSPVTYPEGKTAS